MAKLLFLVFALPLLLLCSCDSSGSGNDNPSEPFGWRSAGLIPNQDSLNTWGNGYMEIVHSGEHIFVRDGKVYDPRTLEPYSRIFMSKPGSDSWEELKLPKNVNPNKMYADEEGLLVGTFRDDIPDDIPDSVGLLWHYNIETEKWTDLNIQSSLPEYWSELSVFGITRFNGRLVVSLGNYIRVLEHSAAFNMAQQPDGSWKDFSPPDNISFTLETPFYFQQAVEWRGKLFMVCADAGTWVYDGSLLSKLSGTLISNTGEPYDIATSIAVHKDRLYTGQYAYGGVQEVMDDYTRVQVDSNSGVNGYYSVHTPTYIKTLVSTGEYLIVSGRSPGVPSVYMGDHGEPKGWRYFGQNSWCDRVRCLAQETYGLDIVGNYLYAATWSGVFKIPLSEIDKAIEGEESYPTFTGE